MVLVFRTQNDFISEPGRYLLESSECAADGIEWEGVAKESAGHWSSLLSATGLSHSTAEALSLCLQTFLVHLFVIQCTGLSSASPSHTENFFGTWSLHSPGSNSFLGILTLEWGVIFCYLFHDTWCPACSHIALQELWASGRAGSVHSGIIHGADVPFSSGLFCLVRPLRTPSCKSPVCSNTLPVLLRRATLTHTGCLGSGRAVCISESRSQGTVVEKYVLLLF